MLTGIAIVFGALLGALLLFATTRPGRFRVERSLSILAPPERIFPLINDFHNWASWSPYEKIDPAMRKKFAGALSGKGAVYEWAGNAKAGQGSMEILASTAASKISIDLHFLKPFEGRNTAEFTLTPANGATIVTWAMFGPTNYVGKLMSLFCSMDKMLGGDFVTGLANIKTITEN